MSDNGERYFVGMSNYEPQMLFFPVNDGAVLRLRLMGDELRVRRIVGAFTAGDDPVYSITGFKYVMDVIRGAPGDHKVRVVTPLLPEIVEPKPVPVKPGKPKKLKPKYRRFRKILEKEFDHFPWTSRVYGCLANNHVITVRDLVSKTEADLLRLPNFGRRSLEEIKKVLRKSRLHLGMDV